MILKEAFEQFAVYKCDVASSFLYAHFDNPALFMDGLSEYLLSESNLLNYFMRCDNVPSALINTLYERLMKNIEMLYYLNSPSKKMLKDLGIYEGDIDSIVSIIGNNFTSIADLQQLLSVHAYKLTNISIVSQYVISRLIN